MKKKAHSCSVYSKIKTVAHKVVKTKHVIVHGASIAMEAPAYEVEIYAKRSDYLFQIVRGDTIILKQLFHIKCFEHFCCVADCPLPVSRSALHLEPRV